MTYFDPKKQTRRSSALTIIDESLETQEIRVQPKQTALSEIVTLLESMGGNLDRLTQYFGGDPHMVIYQIEQRLFSDTDLYERWNKAIDLFYSVQLKMFRLQAFNNLRKIDPDNDKAARVIIAHGKLAIGDLLAAATHSAKAKAVQKTEPSSSLEAKIAQLEEEDEDDDE